MSEQTAAERRAKAREAGLPVSHPNGGKKKIKKRKFKLPVYDLIFFGGVLLIWFLTNSIFPLVLGVLIRISYALWNRFHKQGIRSTRKEAPEFKGLPKIKSKIKIHPIDAIWILALLMWFFTAKAWPWFVAILFRLIYWWIRQDGKNVLVNWWSQKVPEKVRGELSSNLGGGFFGFVLKMIATLIGSFILFQFFGFFALVLGVITGTVFLRKSAQPRYQASTMYLPKPWLRIILGRPLLVFDKNSISPSGVRLGFQLFTFDKRSNFSPTQVASINVDDTLLNFICGAALLTVSDTGGKEFSTVVARWADTKQMEEEMKSAFSRSGKKEDAS